MLRELGKREILHVLLEAGAELNGAALKSDIVDKLVLFYAPKLMGTGGVPWRHFVKLVCEIAGAREFEPLTSTVRISLVEGYFHDVYGNHRSTSERLNRSSAAPKAAVLRVSLAGARAIAAEMKLGDSISVNGCCLTVAEFDAQAFSADLSGETLRRTSFGEKKAGDLVNLERPLAASARLGGHFVQGHVDGVGRVTKLVPEGDNWWLSVKCRRLRRYVAEKGSIADRRHQSDSRPMAGRRSPISPSSPSRTTHTNVRAMTAGRRR